MAYKMKGFSGIYGSISATAEKFGKKIPPNIEEDVTQIGHNIMDGKSHLFFGIEGGKKLKKTGKMKPPYKKPVGPRATRLKNK